LELPEFSSSFFSFKPFKISLLQKKSFLLQKKNSLLETWFILTEKFFHSKPLSTKDLERQGKIKKIFFRKIWVH
jgi:hypothetical protein